MRNKLSFSALRELQDDVSRRWPGLTQAEREDVVQESIAQVLAATSGDAINEVEIVRRASDVAGQVISALLTDRRRGHGLARMPRRGELDPSAGPRAETRTNGPTLRSTDALLPRRRPRPTRAPYRPRGVVRVSVTSQLAQHVEGGIGGLPSRRLRLLARRLIELCEPVIHGEPVTDRETHSLKAAYRACFGDEDPDASWAHVLVDEIRSAASERLDWLDAQAQAAQSLPSAPEPGDGTWMGLLRKAAALKVDPSTPKKFEVPVVPVLVSRRGPRCVVALFGKVLGKVRHLGDTVLVETSAHPNVAYEQRTRAHQAILRTISRLSATPEALGLPSYALDVELVALLIERYGFEGSGGNGKIKPRTMTAMLIDPGELADDLRRYADRQVESADEAGAGKLRTRFNGLLARLHERACVDSNPPPVASNGAGNSRMRVPGGRGVAERKERAKISDALRIELERCGRGQRWRTI